jgi:RHS repeat-associated protein
VDNQVVAEYANGNSKQYAYGSYIDEVLAEQKSESGVTASNFYHRNRQYNTVGLTNSVAELVEAYSTDAMGRVKAFDAAAAAKVAPTATTVLFTGRVFDAETGLYYFRARYFEPELGVFVSRDPLGFVDGKSVYQGWFELRFKLDFSGRSTHYNVNDPQYHIPPGWNTFEKLFDEDFQATISFCDGFTKVTRRYWYHAVRYIIENNETKERKEYIQFDQSGAIPPNYFEDRSWSPFGCLCKDKCWGTISLFMEVFDWRNKILSNARLVETEVDICKATGKNKASDVNGFDGFLFAARYVRIIIWTTGEDNRRIMQ